jgi:hypothetical protein
MKVPSSEDSYRVFELRCQSKRGLKDLSKEELIYLQRMYKDYPDWYPFIDAKIFDVTHPLGEFRDKIGGVKLKETKQ